MMLCAPHDAFWKRLNNLLNYMEKINAGNYNIIIERNSLSHIGEYTAEALGIRGSKFLLISDDTVYNLYHEAAEKSLADAGFIHVKDFVFRHGEQSKNMHTLCDILSHAASEGLTRGDFILALGGGVVGDIAGFASAIYLRGIKYVSIPTSILAAVDSSVGGKTAVDIPEGKNLAGAFHEPSLVLIDPTLLSTLSDEFISDGMAEVIKYGVLGNTALFTLLEKSENLSSDLDSIIAECVKDKVSVVSRDYLDKGERQKLNLGHTFGHGIESLSGYTVSHGHAVASGMYLITECAVKCGLCDDTSLVRLEKLLKKYSLDPFLYRNYKTDDLISASSHDKKKNGNKITLVVPHEIGRCELWKIDFGDMKKFVSGEFKWK